MAYLHTELYRWYHDRTSERLAEGRAAVDKALRLDPDLPYGHQVLGEYYALIDDLERAQHHYLIALSGEPNNARTVLLLGAIQTRRGDWAESIALHKRAIILDPRSERVLWNTGVLLQWLRQYAEAEEYFARALSLAPGDRSRAYSKRDSIWHGDVEAAKRAL